MPLSCLLGGESLGVMNPSSSSFDNSHKLEVLNISHHQGELVKKAIDGNLEETDVISCPPTKYERKKHHQGNEGSVQVPHTIPSHLHLTHQCLSIWTPLEHTLPPNSETTPTPGFGKTDTTKVLSFTVYSCGTIGGWRWALATRDLRTMSASTADPKGTLTELEGAMVKVSSTIRFPIAMWPGILLRPV